jgi:hypothetical protein
MRRWGRAGLTSLMFISMMSIPAHALTASVGGHAIALDGQAEVREVIEENHSTPHDRTQELLRLHATAELANWLKLDTTTVGLNGGPTFQATKSGTFNLDDVFQDVSPSVEFEEAYLDAHFERFDLDVGKQKLAWGKLDRFQPNDLINPERYVDPFLQEEEERKIGIPLVQGSYYPPAADWLPEDSRVTVVWVPYYVPFRFPAVGERWFPPAVSSTTSFVVPAGIATLPDGSPTPRFVVPVIPRTINAPTPPFQFENSEWAGRLAGLVHGADIALYYYHGFDVSPAFSLSARAFGEPDMNPLNPLGVSITAETLLAPVFRTIDSWGADAAYSIGDFTFRAEGAYISGRPFTRDLRFLVRDPSALAPQIREGIAAFQQGAREVPVDLGQSFVVHDAVDWGIGGDYTVAGYFLLLQANQTDVLHNDVDLLIKNVETRLLANLRKNFLSGDLQTQLIGIHSIESDYTVLLPRITYRLTDALDVRVGYLFIAGRASSLLGQYRRNDEGFVRLRYSF